MTRRSLTPPLALAALLAAAAPAAAQYRMPGAMDEGGSKPDPAVGLDELIDAQVPLDLKFRNPNGDWVTLESCVDKKPTVLVLGYNACPQLCSLVLQDLVTAMRAFPADFTAGGRFNVIFVSVDPKEQPKQAGAQQANFVRQYQEGQGRAGAEAGVHFLVGPDAAVNPLAKAVGFRYRYDNQYKEFKHASGIIVLTPAGKTARYFHGLGYAGEYKLAGGGTTTLYQTLVDAGGGKTGALAEGETTSLLCFMRDAIERKYGKTTLLAVRIGGGLALLALVGGLVYLIRREPRPAAAAPPPAGGTPPAASN